MALMKTPQSKDTSANLARHVLKHVVPDTMMTLKRFRKPIGELPRSRFKNVTIEDGSLLLEDIYGEMITLPLDCSKPTIVYQPTDDNQYLVTLPLLDGLTLQVLIHTRLRYDNI